MASVTGEVSAMIRIMMIVLVAAGLAGCSSEVWRRSGGNEQDARADTAACQGAAQQTSQGDGLVYRQFSSYNYFNNCMAERGYLVSVY
jgi:hypothetical protein